MIFNCHLKKIESKFFKKLRDEVASLADMALYLTERYGEGIVSLFELIRWLMLVNFVISLLIVVFVLLPQELYNFDVTKRDLNASFTFEDNSYCQNNTNQTQFSDFNFTDYQTNIVATKCCSLAYKKILNDKISQETESVTDFFLDLVAGAVSTRPLMIMTRLEHGYLTSFLSLLKGKLEDSFLFYGYYSNRSTKALFDQDQSTGVPDERPDKHIYYMGLSFAFISIASLIITAISMLVKLVSVVGSVTCVVKLFCGLFS